MGPPVRRGYVTQVSDLRRPARGRARARHGLSKGHGGSAVAGRHPGGTASASCWRPDRRPKLSAPSAARREAIACAREIRVEVIGPVATSRLPTRSTGCCPFGRRRSAQASFGRALRDAKAHCLRHHHVAHVADIAVALLATSQGHTDLGAHLARRRPSCTKCALAATASVRRTCWVAR